MSKKSKKDATTEAGAEAAVASQVVVNDTSDSVEATDKKSKKRRWRVSRRGFLVGLGITGVGAALGLKFGVPEGQLALAGMLDDAAAPSNVKGSPVAWFEVGTEGTTLYMPKVEMGQGVHTALKQIAAEELELPWDAIQVVSSPTTRGLADGFGTGGSSTVSSLFTPLRETAATMREMLKTKAAEKLSVDVADLKVEDGVVFAAADSSKKLSYAEIVSGVSEWDVPKKAPALKAQSDFKYVGKPMQRVDFKDKLTGKAMYGYDMRKEGMLYGAVARPESFQATMKSADVGAAKSQAGVVDVVITEDFAGVVATSRAAAYKGVEALNVVWDEHSGFSTADAMALCTVEDGSGLTVQREGNAPKALKADSAKVIQAEYRTPMAAHSHLEPQAALAHVQGDKLEAWVSTQAPFVVRDDLAEAMGFKKENVDVTATFLGGGFGRRLSGKVAIEAARLSQATGKPVHVGWNRTEEFKYGYLRPPTHNVLKATLNGSKIEAMEHQVASGDVAFPFFPEFLTKVFGADFGAWRGATNFYDGIENRRTLSQRVKLPFDTGWWRGLGLLANTFAQESFMDELAHAAGVDALEFRLEHFAASEDGQRFRGVLTKAAEMADWGGSLPEGHAQGIACSTDVNTKVAQVAEVSIENGKIRVHKISCAMDCGLTINPDGAAAQAQGGIIMSLSSVFLEKVDIADSRIQINNFDSYPLITMRDAPEINVEMVDSGPEPFGVGEPPMGPTAAAVANAVFALTGQRLRELPLKLNA